MKIIFKIISYLFVVVVASIALLLVLSALPLKLDVKVVKSGSMEPVIQTGGIVVIAPTSSYEVGDIITFGKDTKTQIPTTHRIVGIEEHGKAISYLTKGDANNAPDPTLTPKSEVHGRMLFTVPYLGYILDFARKPIGFALLVGLPALLLIIDELGKVIREVRRIRQKRQGKDKHPGVRYSIRLRADLLRRQKVVVEENSGGIGKTTKTMTAIAFVLIALGAWHVGGTQSYYRDAELSRSNLLQAIGVDIETHVVPAPTHFEEARAADNDTAVDSAESISQEAIAAAEMTDFVLAVDTRSAALPLRYSVLGESEESDSPECGALTISVIAGVASYSGSLTSLFLPDIQDLGSVAVTVDPSLVSEGIPCTSSLLITAYLDKENVRARSIYSDSERYTFVIHGTKSTGSPQIDDLAADATIDATVEDPEAPPSETSESEEAAESSLEEASSVVDDESLEPTQPQETFPVDEEESVAQDSDTESQTE